MEGRICGGQTPPRHPIQQVYRRRLPDVFADACKLGLEGTCRSARTRPTFQDARPTVQHEELGYTGHEAGGGRGLGPGAVAMNVARPVPGQKGLAPKAYRLKFANV